MLQYLPLSEQLLDIHLVSYISARRKSRSSECNTIFPSSLPEEVIVFFFFSDRGGGKKFSYAKNVFFLLMLHAIHLTVHYMANAKI